MILYLNYINRKTIFSIEQDERQSDAKAHIDQKIKNILKIKKNRPKNLWKKKNFKKKKFFCENEKLDYPSFQEIFTITEQ